MKKRKKGYGILLFITIIFTLAAISTLIPVSSSSKECYLGYKAHCTFTPIGTIICLIAAGSVCKIRKKFFTSQEDS
ncbi:MAG: hypothetical protein KKH98_14630 [Spirochaetes bacterium]|nr:hypothetical protein [Spirochaetota bacterium]